ncbi:MAG: C-type lectin domain-containing protein, partial [Pseudorhodobacter sp.]
MRKDPDMPITTLHFQGHTYEINIRALNWSDANLMARDNGGYLAKITSATENAAIFNLAKAYFNASSTQYIAPDGGGGAYVWIGGTDSVREGTWRWSDGSALSGYANWGAGNGVTEPDNFNGIQDHLGLSLNGWP